jgi:ClpP class serine protease
MSPMDLFWLILMLSAFQPVITRRLLEYSRQRLISKIEQERGSRVILLVHREEKMNLLGFPVYRYIDVDDSEEVIRAIHLTDPHVPLDLILHTPGGLVLASLQIAEAIKKHKGKVTVFVPHYAMSGGTLIALAADDIVMSQHAVLGPVDPQLGRFPAASILKVLGKKPIKDIEDETLILADQADKAIIQVRESVKELLQGKQINGKEDELARLLAHGTWTHDFPITYDRAKSLGLHVKSDIPDEILKLMSLYPQPVRTQPTVEYLPGPRTRRSERERAGSGRPGAGS